MDVLLHKRYMLRKGFTLIELLIVVFLTVILSTVGYLSISKRLLRERVVSEVMGFANDLNNVKNRALLENRRFGVRIPDSLKYDIIYYDANGNLNLVSQRPLSKVTFGTISGVNSCPDGSAIDVNDGVNFPGNEIIFLPIGTPVASGCVVMHAAGRLGAIVVTPSGDIKSYIRIRGNWVEK